MIKNTLLDYINIRLSICALRLIAPASIVYLVCCAVQPLWWNIPLGFITAAEASFYLLVYLPRRKRLQAPPTELPPTLTRAQRQTIFLKCLEAAKFSSQLGHRYQPYPTGWFLPSNSTPKREDAVEWLVWAFFSSSAEDIDLLAYADELDGYIKQIETILGRELEPGHSRDDKSGIKSMRITLDPVRMLHRPLVWYFIVTVVDAYTCIYLMSLGFKHYTPSSPQWSRCFPPRPILSLLSKPAPPGVALPYWYKPHKSRTKTPMMFLHGIGIGLYPYIPFIRSIVTGDDAGVGILLPELLPISMHMTPRSVPSRAIMLASLDLILESLKVLENADNVGNGLAQSQETDNNDTETETEVAMRKPLLFNTDVSSDFGSTFAQKTGWNHIVLCSHSYGTFVAGWIIRLCVDEDNDNSSFAGSGLDTPPVHLPPITTCSTPAIPTNLANKIAHLILVDPIPILLSHPAVAHNFLYREPSTVCPRRLGSAGIDATTNPSEYDDDRELDTATDLPLTRTLALLHSGASPTSSASTSRVALSSPTQSSSASPAAPPSFSPSWYSSASAWQLWYFASRDADVARTLFRSFFWAEGGIWREDVEAFLGGMGRSPSDDVQLTRSPDPGRAGRYGRRNMAVFLGGMDQIVPAEAIRHYLTREEWAAECWVGDVDCADDDSGEEHCAVPAPTSQGKLEVHFNQALDHAVIFDEERWTMPLLEVVGRYVREV